ncbi:MAG: sigma 54 modulation/S30EA ribosomal C-terminal domain-containing protein, partial [Chloroflexi bacterium]|nr:sigma 54 modulation/S30EA ribosomal C-terminal domain-containing protein [Chloroflexota bacterium]
SDLTAAIDAAAHAIDLQAKRYKEKLHVKNRKSIKEIEGQEYTVIESVETSEPSKVVKTKRFPLQPMSIDDAMHQMELLGHDFFFFYNKQTDSYSVLYLRDDGDFGLIEPEK